MPPDPMPSRPAAHTLSGGLRDLIRLRIIEILIQAGALAALAWGLGYPLEYLPLAATLIALSLWNLWSWHLLRAGRLSTPNGFFIQLLPDIIALTIIFYYTGGATNPFVWIYLFPLVITATALPRRYAWFMVALTIACYSLLMFYYRPLPGSHIGHQMSGFSLHIHGMWLGFVLSAILFAYFIGRLADNLRERDRALALAREQALRDERIVALGALATGAAHELGTPLATIALVSEEIDAEHGETLPGLHAQLELISAQVLRCKESLSVLTASSQGEGQARAGRLVSVSDFIEHLLADWRARRPGVHPRTVVEMPDEALVLADETLRQAICNVLDNAADVSPGAIEIAARQDHGRLLLSISDRGPGMLSNRREQPGDGLGLGLFLAHATIRRLGGAIHLFERGDGPGTRTEIRIPLVNPDD